MATADLTVINDILKEVFTGDKLNEQLYTEHEVLNEVEKTNKFTIGKQASTPIYTQDNLGYTAVPDAGSDALNAASTRGYKKATWNLKNHNMQVSLDANAINSAAESKQSVAATVTTEIDGAVNGLRRQLARQLYSNGDALMAQCTTTTASTTVNLDPTGYGYEALRRGWIQPGMTVDIGTTASEASIVADAVIASVSISSTAPSITIGTSVTTTSSHYVSVANARSGTTSYEMNGLRNIISTTATLGTLDPATYQQWKAASVDTSTAALTLAALQTMDEEVQQNTGDIPASYIFSVHQSKQLYGLLQTQVNFGSNEALGFGAGKMGAALNGKRMFVDPDCPSRNIFAVDLSKFVMVTGNKNAPYWQNEIAGGNPLVYKQGTTRFVGTLFYSSQIGVYQRNCHAGMTGLTA